MFQEWSKTINFFGPRKSLYILLFRIINKFLFLKIYYCLKNSISDLHTPIDDQNSGYQTGFAKQNELTKLVANEEFETTESFIKNALEKGDRCYTIGHNGEIITYLWNSVKPTKLTHDLIIYLINHIFINIKLSLIKTTEGDTLF